MKWHLQIHQYDGETQGQVYQYGTPIFSAQGYKAMLMSANSSLWNHALALDFTTSLCPLKLLHTAQSSAQLATCSFLSQMWTIHRQHNSHRHGSPTHKPLTMVTSRDPLWWPKECSNQLGEDSLFTEARWCLVEAHQVWIKANLCLSSSVSWARWAPGAPI